MSSIVEQCTSDEYACGMRLRVLFFGVLRDRFGEAEELAQFPGASAAELVAYYRVIAPELNPLWGAIAVAVNQRYATGVTALADGDEVALLPPVSGGSGAADSDQKFVDSGLSNACDVEPVRVALTHEAIDAKQVADALKAGEDGAVTVFDGIVRNNTKGRPTLYLDYTAYEAMALEQMRSLAEEAVTRFGVRGVAMVHRLGRLEVGETSVLIAVASAHRGVTFEACRWLIDMLKKQVPIWKKEVFVDGAVWGAGEPFPAEMVVGE